MELKIPARRNLKRINYCWNNMLELRRRFAVLFKVQISSYTHVYPVNMTFEGEFVGF